MAKALVIKGANFSANKVTTVTFDDTVPCTGISLNKSTSTIDGIGTTDVLTATVTPSDCTELISWESSDSSIVSVSNGVLTAVGFGSAVITARCGDFSATCSVAVTVTPDYVLVAGYIPERRTSTGSAATTGKVTSSSTVSNHILAQNSSDTSIYPIESKSNVDTSPWRFVPIEIPNGVTKIKISTANQTTTIKTRILFFNRNDAETQFNIGAYCLYGNRADAGFDQADWAIEQTIDVPSVSGINSFGGLVYLKDVYNPINENYADLINVEFLDE